MRSAQSARMCRNAPASIALLFVVVACGPAPRDVPDASHEAIDAAPLPPDAAGDAGASVDAAVPDAAVASIDDVVAPLTDALCAAQIACLGAPVRSPWLPAECEAIQGPWVELGVARARAAVAGGEARFAADRLAQCLEAIKLAPCEALEIVLEGCAGLVTGLVDEGAACSTYSCEPGTTCSVVSGCEGTCRRHLLEGEVCGGAVVEQCGRGLLCRPDSSTTSVGTCRPRLPVGSACDGDPECEAGLVCASDTIGGPFTCHASRDLYHGDEGEPCGLTTATLCRRDLACMGDATGANPTCQPPVPSGGECGYGARCAEPDEWCDATFGATGLCRAVGGEGDACSGALDCGPGLRCRASGVCAVVGEIGAACDESEDCTTGVCTGGTCAYACK